MARFRSKRSLPVRGGCVDVRPEIRAALDAGDLATAAAVLHGRPPCPVAMATDEYLLPPIGSPTIPGVFGDCPVCAAVLDMIRERPAFLASFSVAPDGPADVIPTTTEVFDHDN